MKRGQVPRDPGMTLTKRGQVPVDPGMTLKRPDIHAELPNVMFRTFKTNISRPSWTKFFQSDGKEDTPDIFDKVNESIMDDDDDVLYYSEEFLFRPVLSGRILGGDGEVAVLGFEDIEDAEEIASTWTDSDVLSLNTHKAILHAEAMHLPFLFIKPATRGGNIKSGTPREARLFGYI